MQNIKNILMIIAVVLALEVVNVGYTQSVQPANTPAVTTTPAVTGNTAPTDGAKKKKKHNKKKDQTPAPAPAK